MNFVPSICAVAAVQLASPNGQSFVAQDHFLRRIDSILNLSFLRELTAVRYADGQGRPSIDPEVFFRMQLVAYFYGMSTDRRLCEEVQYNLAYRWFCHLSLEDDVKITTCRGRSIAERRKCKSKRILAQLCRT